MNLRISENKGICDKKIEDSVVSPHGFQNLSLMLQC